MKMEITVAEARELFNELHKQPGTLFEMIRETLAEYQICQIAPSSYPKEVLAGSHGPLDRPWPGMAWSRDIKKLLFLDGTI